MSAEIRDLMKRVERLERQNRRMKSAGMTGLLLLGVVLVLGQAAPPASVLRAETVVATKGFVLADGAGKPRASLGTFEGQPALTLFGGDDPKPRVQIGAWDRGSSVMLLDSQGRERAMFSVVGEVGSLNLIGADSKLRASLGVVHDAGMAFLFDREGAPLWTAP